MTLGLPRNSEQAFPAEEQKVSAMGFHLDALRIVEGHRRLPDLRRDVFGNGDGVLDVSDQVESPVRPTLDEI